LPCSCRANLQPYHPSLASHAALLIDAVFWVQAKNIKKPIEAVLQCRKNDLKRHKHAQTISNNIKVTAGLQSAISSAYIPAKWQPCPSADKCRQILMAGKHLLSPILHLNVEATTPTG